MTAFFKRLADHYLAAIAVVTATLNTLVLIQSNPPTGLVLTAVSTLLAAAILCGYVLIAKAPSHIEGAPRPSRYPHRRRQAAIGLAAVGFLTALLIVLPHPRLMLRLAFLGAFSKPSLLVVSSSDNAYRLEVTVRNPLRNELLIRRIEIYEGHDQGIACCCPPESTFVLSDSLQLLKLDERSTALTGRAYRRSDTAYTYAVSGTKVDLNCFDSGHSQLGFDVALVLQPQRYTTLAILVPRHLGIVPSARNAKVTVSLIGSSHTLTAAWHRGQRK